MPIYRGAYFAKGFLIKDADSGLPINVDGWTFKVQLRDRTDDVEPLLELTTDNGGFVIVDALAGEVSMRITAVQSAALPVARLVFDVLRTDPDPGPLWLFAGKVPVKEPVTRDV
jgi:hypothetical protein